MPHWFRRCLQVLLALTLLWQTAVMPTAALAGCCDGEQPCCLAFRAAAGCLTCVPVLADNLVAMALAPVGAMAAPVFMDWQVHLSGLVHDIWRPPMA